VFSALASSRLTSSHSMFKILRLACAGILVSVWLGCETDRPAHIRE